MSVVCSALFAEFTGRDFGNLHITYNILLARHLYREVVFLYCERVFYSMFFSPFLISLLYINWHVWRLQLLRTDSLYGVWIIGSRMKR